MYCSKCKHPGPNSVDGVERVSHRQTLSSILECLNLDFDKNIRPVHVQLKSFGKAVHEVVTSTPGAAGATSNSKLPATAACAVCSFLQDATHSVCEMCESKFVPVVADAGDVVDLSASEEAVIGDSTSAGKPTADPA